MEFFPCDVLFVHRDAEEEDPNNRYDEIRRALPSGMAVSKPYVCVVPVRMTEAWLLTNEAAIRRAAGNPRGRMKLSLPAVGRIERIPDPKETLFAAIRIASGLDQRRLRKVNTRTCRLRIAELTSDYSPLLRLKAFQRLEADIRGFLGKCKGG